MVVVKRILKVVVKRSSKKEIIQKRRASGEAEKYGKHIKK